MVGLTSSATAASSGISDQMACLTAERTFAGRGSHTATRHAARS